MAARLQRIAIPGICGNTGCMLRFALMLLVALPCIAQQAAKAQHDYSGTYSFVKDGETLQLNIDNGKVDGFVSRLGDLESDKGTFIDQFFTKAELKGEQLTFTTKPVHNVWFEFRGKIERGPGKTRADDKYYVLKGKLIRYYTDPQKNTTAEERTVVFESLPEGLVPAN